jgi:hypothetical protein
VPLFSSALVESRRLSIMRRLSAAPVLRPAVAAAQVVSCLVVAAGQSAGLLLVGRVIFGVHCGNPFAVGLIRFLLSVSYGGASGILGTWVRTEEQARRLHVPRSTSSGPPSALSAISCPKRGPWTRS